MSVPLQVLRDGAAEKIASLLALELFKVILKD